MKCIHCARDAKLKERVTGTCPGCGKRFVFEPRSGDLFTDMGFQAAISRVSGNGTVKFSAANLFYEVKRVTRSRKGPAVGLALGSAFSASLLLSGSYLGGLICLSISGLGLFMLRYAGNPFETLSFSSFEGALAKWRSVNGDPPGLLVPARLPGQASAELQAELESYSFDRAVITDMAETADLLLANDFHFENNCAVLSIDGSPAYAFETVRRMLRKNPRIEVFALHDCTVQGCSLAWKLRNDEQWFKGFEKVYDVALRPAQTPALKRFWERVPEEAMHPGISATEAQWLRKWSVSLAALRPEQLIKRLYRAMQAKEALSAGNAEGGEGDGGGSDLAFTSTDASASDGGADSFG